CENAESGALPLEPGLVVGVRVDRHVDRLADVRIVEGCLVQVENYPAGTVDEIQLVPGLTLSLCHPTEVLRQRERTITLTCGEGVEPLGIVSHDVDDVLVDVGTGKVEVVRVPGEYQLAVLHPLFQDEGPCSNWDGTSRRPVLAARSR